MVGKHTDYAGGRTLLPPDCVFPCVLARSRAYRALKRRRLRCAVNRGFLLVASAREDAVLRVVSLQEERLQCEVELRPDVEAFPAGFSSSL